MLRVIVEDLEQRQRFSDVFKGVKGEYFEGFITFLGHCQLIWGNSSRRFAAGVKGIEFGGRTGH